jgi:hypothetical protein
LLRVHPEIRVNLEARRLGTVYTGYMGLAPPYFSAIGSGNAGTIHHAGDAADVGRHGERLRSEGA